MPSKYEYKHKLIVGELYTVWNVDCENHKLEGMYLYMNGDFDGAQPIFAVDQGHHLPSYSRSADFYEPLNKYYEEAMSMQEVVNAIRPDNKIRIIGDPSKAEWHILGYDEDFVYTRDQDITYRELKKDYEREDGFRFLKFKRI